MIINYAHAAEVRANVAASEEVMDLDSTEVASIVNTFNPYTPNMVEDPVAVALSVQNQDFIGKPIIFDTAQTQIVDNSKNTSRNKTISYTVKDGDTISSIGWNFGLKIATIKVTNNLKSDTIKAGQILKLPPEDISAAAIRLASQRLRKVAGASTQGVRRRPGSSVNGYPWGWCTYYVATRRYVPPHWGNASSWLSSARASGYATGYTAQAGSIMVTNESWLGHVAYVERVGGGTVSIAEMNARGFGIVSRRTLSVRDSKIRGYIY